MQIWIKTTKAQKEAWTGSEIGSYEDQGSPRLHAYTDVKGSYYSSIYLDETRIERVAKSFATSTFSEYAPKHWKKLLPQMLDACEKFGRADLAAAIRDVARTL